MAEQFRQAAVFAPGEYIQDELTELGWSLADFARLTGWPEQLASDVLSGAAKITVSRAETLHRVFGSSAITWLKLERAYRQWKP